MKKTVSDSIIVGLALFAMFFGAGNLIFPPQIGLEAGRIWYLAAFGFLLTGIGLPLLGIFASVMGGEALKNFQPKVGKPFLISFEIVVVLTLGFVAIPRTGATTHEMGFNTFFNGISPIVSSIIFFGITIVFAIKPTGIVDRIGKFLTPVLVTMLGIIIVKGIISPIHVAEYSHNGNTFSLGFFGGYQTMDALGALIFGGIMINTFKEKGYHKVKDQVKMTALAGGIAALGLALVYGGLMYLGSTVAGFVSHELSKTTLTMLISSLLLGQTGTWLLGFGVSAACLTTSIGLVATIADFFSDITKGKIPYKLSVVLLSVVSGVVSVRGVDKIVNVASPILIVVYPVAIVLMLFIIFDRILNMPRVYRMTLGVTLSISVIEGMNAAELLKAFTANILTRIPLSDIGFSWLLPTVITFIVCFSWDSIGKHIEKRKVVEKALIHHG